VIGTYPLQLENIIDGDTIRLPNGLPSVRILGIDTEETFKHEEDRKAAAADFAAYAKAKRGKHPRPVKYGTPAGDAAAQFLKTLATGCTSIRLERDRVGGRERGTFGRILAHVFLLKKGEPAINVSEALIRAGQAPYFNKYGRSARFDKLYATAQAEARVGARGIWAQSGPAHYPDYPERLAWWTARADQIARWQKVAAQPGHVTLGEPEAMKRLTALAGKDATVFGLLARELPIKAGDKRIFLLSQDRRHGFALVFFDLEAAKTLDEREPFHSMYATVRGKVTLYHGQPQMVLEHVAQVSTK